MISTSDKAPKQPKIEYNSTTNWRKGVISRLDDDRTPTEALSTTENVVLSQNGTVRPRKGLKLYGTQPTNPVLGQIYEFVKMSGTTPQTWLIWMENRSGVGTVVVAKDGGAQTVVGGKTYSSTAKAHFEQVGGTVLITNGSDNLSYMTISTLVITPFASLSTPSAPTAVATVINGSVYTLRYKITATNQGETSASTAGTVGVSTERGLWTGTTEYVTLTITRVTGASRYNIYVGDQAGYEYYLDTVVDPGSGTTFTYKDTGAIDTNILRIAPVGDSTPGPKTTRSTNVKGQIYMVGDIDYPERIWFGGTLAEAALDFSSYNGGGWVAPNKGGKDFPACIRPFRDGKGTPMAACFSKGTNGSGKRYLLQPSTLTVGSTVITYMSVQEDNGQDGTDSPDGVIMIDDGAFYPSRTGFKTTNTKAQIQNILSTTGISDNISDSIQSLSGLNMDLCVGATYDRRLYWALPFGSSTNNQVWTLDLRQKGAWMRPWNIAADWITLYADNTTGMTQLLFLVGNKIYTLDESTLTNDDGTVFTTNIGSGAIKFSEDGEQYGSIIDVTFIFLRPQGLINLSVLANTEDGAVTITDTVTTTTNDSISGWGAYAWSDNGWGNLLYGVPLAVSSNIPRVRKTIEVDEECNYITWGVNSTAIGVDYELADVILRYVAVGWIDKDS